ncbi:MAG: nucleotide exchange factor GrpE [Candidatus Saccharimonadaceae bacterium]|nr:nucleotide exchange factor GrpE [Candidatus Saccharimonadaceae bacterium]
MVKKSKKDIEFEQKIGELTQDLQRTRADFENFRKRCELDQAMARQLAQAGTILKLLPVIDNIERAIAHIPDELKENAWAQGIAGLAKNLEKSLENMNLKRIEAAVGTAFNPDLHEAIQFDEEATGEQEVIAEELQAGYTLNGQPIRHSMVKVTRQ